MRRRLFVLAVVAVAWAMPAGATGLAGADARKVRAVVQAQLDAFAHDDAARAFSYAAPNIRAMFGSAERFRARVRHAYPVVYRPASVAFLVPGAAPGRWRRRCS